MKLPWQKGGPGPPVAGGEIAEAQSCPPLVLACEALGRLERPAVLDLGPMCGETVVWFADRGARVSVDNFAIPDTAPDEEATGPWPRIDHPDGAFDLVLAWEWCDFVAPARLDAFAGELRRLIAPDGWLLLFSLNLEPPADSAGDRPARFRIVDDGRVVRETMPGNLRPRSHHPTRRLEAALAPLEVRKLHLQRDQRREYLAHKPRAAAARPGR